MKSYFKMLLFICLLTNICQAQENFIKKITKDETVGASQIIEYNGRYFVLNSGVCDNISECSHVIEINDGGDVIWEKRLDWLDVASKSMIIENDTIYLSGNHFSSSRWYWHQMSIDGDSLATHEIFAENKLRTNMFNFGQIKSGENFCIYGSGNVQDTMLSLLYFIDKNGALDTLVEIFESSHLSNPWEVISDNNGDLIVFIRYITLNSDRQTVVARLNEFHDVTWTYYSEENIFNNTIPNGTILNNGVIVLNYINNTSSSSNNSLIALSLDGSILWKYNNLGPDWLTRVFFKIHTLKDGSIIGFGQWGDVSEDPIIEGTPWIIKVSSEGDLLWERAFYDYLPGATFAKSAWFYDGVELNDSSFLVVGSIREQNGVPRDILIARLDSEGCLIEDCSVLNDVSDILNNADDVELTSKATIYPNPVLDVLTIASEDIPDKVNIYSINGKLLFTKLKTNEISVSSLSNGIYFIRVHFKGREEILKFVKF